MSWPPALREDLVITRDPEAGGAGADDAVHDRHVNMGLLSWALAQRLDGARTPDQAIDETALREAVPRPRVEAALRSLLLLGLCTGVGDATRARLRDLRSGAESLGPLVLEEGRFACQGSGACCQGYAFGPLSDADCARLLALEPQIRRQFPALTGPLFEEKGEAPRPVIRYLPVRGERCAYLLPDLRCGLHAAFGPDSKPGFCGLYPLVTLPTIDGLKVYDGGECASFATSARTGPSTLDDLERIERLMPERLDLFHPIVLFDPGVPADFAYFLRFQRAACDLVACDVGGAAETLGAVCRLLREFMGVLASFPLEPGEPDRAIEALCASGPGAFRAPARPLDPAGAAAVAALMDDLLGALTSAIAYAAPTPEEFLSAHVARELAAVLHLVRSVAASRMPRPAPLTAWFAEVAAVELDDPEIDAVLKTSLRQQLFGHRALVDQRPAPALLRIAVAQLAALFGARLRAAVDRRPAARAADLSFGHMLANRILRQAAVARVFVVHEDLTDIVIDAMPGLLDPPSRPAQRPAR